MARSIIADYERGKLRLNDKVIIKLANILKISSDELLGIKNNNKNYEPSLRLMRRLIKIEKLPENKKISGDCQSIDIMPTILDLVDIPIPKSCQGKSLLPAVKSGYLEPKPIFFESLYGRLDNRKGYIRTGIIY